MEDSVHGNRVERLNEHYSPILIGVLFPTKTSIADPVQSIF
jgi:hypothetical protein